MKQLIILSVIIFSVFTLKAQVIINTDGTHGIVAGQHVHNSDGSLSVIHGNHIINQSGAISVIHGSHIINQNGITSLLTGSNDFLSDSFSGKKAKKTDHPNQISREKPRKLIKKGNKEIRKHKNRLRKIVDQQ